MKTVVYQSFRTHEVPAWMQACMASVRAWAASQGYDYRFYDDAFLDRAPAWFRQRAGRELCPVTDLARLVVAKELLAEGYERTVWADADLLVFDPGALALPVTQGFAFCLELWLYSDASGAQRVSPRVNNAMAVFCVGSLHLDFFIDAAVRIGRQRESIGKLDIGTAFLSPLRQILPFPLLDTVGMLSPAFLTEVAVGRPQGLHAYMQALPAPLAAANLCASLQDARVQGVVAGETVFEQAVERLLASRGEMLNALRGRP